MDFLGCYLFITEPRLVLVGTKSAVVEALKHLSRVSGNILIAVPEKQAVLKPRFDYEVWSSNRIDSSSRIDLNLEPDLVPGFVAKSWLQALTTHSPVPPPPPPSPPPPSHLQLEGRGPLPIERAVTPIAGDSEDEAHGEESEDSGLQTAVTTTTPPATPAGEPQDSAREPNKNKPSNINAAIANDIGRCQPPEVNTATQINAVREIEVGADGCGGCRPSVSVPWDAHGVIALAGGRTDKGIMERQGHEPGETKLAEVLEFLNTASHSDITAILERLEHLEHLEHLRHYEWVVKMVDSPSPACRGSSSPGILGDAGGDGSGEEGTQSTTDEGG